MIDGMLYQDEGIKVDLFGRKAIITTKKSALEFFRCWDGSKLEGIYCLDFKSEKMKRVFFLEEALAFYEGLKCECGKDWDENGVCKE